MPRIKLMGHESDIIKLYKSGKTTNEIADIYSVNPRTVTRIARSAGYLPSPIQNSIDIDLAISLYTSGVSENAIAKQFGVSRSVIRNRLLKSGVVIRGQTEANQLSMSQRTPEEKARNAQSAHDAIRGKSYSRQELCERASKRQKSFTSFDSPYEIAIANELRCRGIKFIPQLAVDKYNIDFAIGNYIAFEVFGGHWHSQGRAAARFDDRSKHIFSTDRAIVICWFSLNTISNIPAIVDYLISLDKVLCSDPAARCKHYVIGSDGKPSAIGSSKLNYIT